MSFETFYLLYIEHLGAEDLPDCPTAYLRAEADHVKQEGGRKYKNYNTFRVAIAKRRKRRRENVITF